MAEIQTLARPYADAIFQLAKNSGSLATWSEMLGLIHLVASDANMQRLASDPRVDRQRFQALFLEICGSKLNEAGANLLRLLVENHRLTLMPEIVRQFEALKAEAEARVDVLVTSAFALKSEQITALSQALKRKLGREVNITSEVDASLVGGIVIRAGDLVIDSSVRGRLAELTTHLSH